MPDDSARNRTRALTQPTPLSVLPLVRGGPVRTLISRCTRAMTTSGTPDRARAGRASRQCARSGRWAQRRRTASHLVDPAEVGAADEEPRCAVAGPLPAWVSTGDFQKVLTALLGKDAPNLSPP
jgi:hypothetical protein